jgi:hypothetical protein
MSSLLFKKSRFAIPLGILFVFLAVVVFMAQPGLYPEGSEVNGTVCITTLPATNIGVSSATLNGSPECTVDNMAGRKVFAACGDWGYYFVWGNAPGSFPNQTPIQLTSGTNFSALISGLSPFTTYYYKAAITCIAQNANSHAVFAGTAYYGQQMSFTTLGNAGGLNSLFNVDSSPTGGTPSNIIVNGNGGSQVTQVNQPVTVYARVINSGDMEGGFTVNLKVNGYVEQTKMGVVPGHEAVPVEFTIVKDVPGTYDIDIEGSTTTLTVLSAEQSSNSPSQSQYIFIAVIGLAVVLIALTTVLIMRRRTN